MNYNFICCMKQLNIHQNELNSDKSELQEEEETAAFLRTKGYDLEKRIGNGTFGKVYLVLSDKYKIHFVIKKITSQINHKNDILHDEILNDKTDLKEPKKLTINSEIQSLILLDHPGIIKLYEYFSQPIIKGEMEGENENTHADAKKEEENVYLVLEYCENGSLNDLIRKGPIKPPRLYAFCKQIATALLYCHQNDIAHRDIKPANILVGANNRLKLGDFGLSTIIKNGQRCNKYAGSYLFMAPEVLDMKDFDPYEADVWALGITFYMMATGVPPWYSSSREVLRKMAKTADLRFPSYIDRNFANLIRSMLTHDPLHRAKMKDIASHPILQQMTSHSSLCEIKFNTKVSFNHSNMNGIELNQMLPNYDNNTSNVILNNDIQVSKSNLNSNIRKNTQQSSNTQTNTNNSQNEYSKRRFSSSSSFCPPFPSNIPHSCLHQSSQSNIHHSNSIQNPFLVKETISSSNSCTKIFQDTPELKKGLPPIPITSTRPKIQMFSSTPLLQARDDSMMIEHNQEKPQIQMNENPNAFTDNSNEEINIENFVEVPDGHNRQASLDSVKTFRVNSLDARRRNLLTPRRRFRSQMMSNNNDSAC